MRIKKYTARSMREALLQIKDELGEDAVILKTRHMPGKFLGVGGNGDIEVTAAIEDVQPVKEHFKPIAFNNQAGYTREASKTSSYIPVDSPPESALSQESSSLLSNNLKEDIREVKELVRSMITTGTASAAGGFTGGWAVLYKRLIDADVRHDCAVELIEIVRLKYPQSDNKIDKAFIAAVTDRFQASGPLKAKKGGPLVVVLVGPTGCGKTTTLAKLAAHFVLSKKRTASIITADTYRIAAIEQIKTFADIVGIKCEAVFSPGEAKEALAACATDDAVFVDTAGRSQRHPQHMDELKELLEAIGADQIHLVLSATTKDSDVRDMIARFKPLGVNRLLFTKLDETIRLGTILNTIMDHQIPVSYFTSGQSVPDDIELAQPGRFIEHLWEGGRS